MNNGTIQVGFDFDEPIYPWYQRAHEACIRAGLADPKNPWPRSWAPHEEYGVDLEDWIAVLDKEVETEDGMYHGPFVDGVVEDIRRLYTNGYGIHIITARGSFGKYGERIKKITYQSLHKYGLPYDTLTFTNSKTEAARGLHLDYFLDDRPLHYEEVASVPGVDVYLLDSPWNEDFEVPPGKRLKSTHEYVKTIFDLHGPQFNKAKRPHGVVPAEQTLARR